jgi:hypothetical protein
MTMLDTLWQCLLMEPGLLWECICMINQQQMQELSKCGNTRIVVYGFRWGPICSQGLLQMITLDGLWQYLQMGQGLLWG